MDKVKSTNTILISGGETLVNLTGSGKGGRNQEFALSFLKKYLDSKCNKEICLYSAGTDGIDGPTDAAGAIVDSVAIDAYASSNLEAYASIAALSTIAPAASVGPSIPSVPAEYKHISLLHLSLIHI